MNFCSKLPSLLFFLISICQKQTLLGGPSQSHVMGKVPFNSLRLPKFPDLLCECQLSALGSASGPTSPATSHLDIRAAQLGKTVVLLKQTAYFPFSPLCCATRQELRVDMASAQPYFRSQSSLYHPC